MKTLLKKVLLLTLTSSALWSCKKDEIRATISDGKAGSVTASSSALVLTKEDADKPALTFNITTADFGYRAAIKNTLQFDVKGNNFASPKEVAADAGKLTKSFTVLEFNTLLLAMNLPTDVASEIEMRVKSQVVDSQIPAVFSQPVSLTVTPYSSISYIYVPGAYQDWKPETADSLVSVTGNGIYEGIINFPPNKLAFKITPAKNWSVNYGDAGSGKISTTGGDLQVPSAGSYLVKVDLNALTIELTPTIWGVIGDATAGGWDADTDMSYNNGTRTWSVTTTLKVGAFKFRKNHDWGTNFGDKTGDRVLDTENDNNIPITEAGQYKITLDLSNNSYTLQKQ